MIIYKRIEILIKYKRIKITIKYKYTIIPTYQIFSPVFAIKIPKAEPRREKCLSQCVHPCPFRNRGAEHATKPRWSFLRVFCAGALSESSCSCLQKNPHTRPHKRATSYHLVLSACVYTRGSCTPLEL